MTRILPHPLLTAALILMWLLLTRFSLGHLVLGSVIAVLAGLALARIEPEAPRIRSWSALLRLVAIVSVFVVIPLRLRDPVPLALLAVILTATPGTAWLEHDREAGTLLLHVFDMVDEEEWRVLIRDRYEALLMESFA